jgi:antitoxin component of MazEF toxin-antitoxin module
VGGNLESPLASLFVCYYSKHMVIVKLKVARIGNSRGVRLPAAALRRYRIGETVLMEERSEGILLRPTGPAVEKLSWEETARAMGASREDWSAWDTATADGLDDLLWQNDRKGRVAEPRTRYRARPSRKKQR